MRNASCPECAATYQVQDSLVGQAVRCTQCQTVFVVPQQSEPADLLTPASTPSTSYSPPKGIQQRKEKQDKLNAQAKARLEKIAQYRWVGWVLIAGSILFFALIILTQSAILGFAWPASPVMLLIGIALLTFDSHKHNLDTVTNTAEKYCRDCGYEVAEWKVVAKQVGLHLKHVPMMPRLNNQSKRACPNCGCFCFEDTVKPYVSALRVPTALLVAALVALIVFLSRDISAHPLEYGFVSGGITFWTSLAFVGWPIQWCLLFFWQLKTGRSFWRSSKNLNGYTGLPGPVQQHLYLHGFSTSFGQGKLTVLAERVAALDRTTKWIWFVVAWAILGIVFMIPIAVLVKSQSLYPALAVLGTGLFLAVVNAAFLFARDRLNNVLIEFNANGMLIEEHGPIKWPKSTLSLLRNQIVQFFVDTTKTAVYSSGEGGGSYVGDQITHSLSAVSDKGRRLPLIRTDNQALAELQELEHQIEHFWGIQDVQVKEFGHGVTTYAARQNSGSQMQTKWQGFSFRVPVLIACSLVTAFIWFASGLAVAKIGFQSYRKDLQDYRANRSRERSEEREKKYEERRIQQKAEEDERKRIAVKTQQVRKHEMNQWLVNRLAITTEGLASHTVDQLSDKLELNKVPLDDIPGIGLDTRVKLREGIPDNNGKSQSSWFLIVSGDSKPRTPDAANFKIRKILDAKSFQTQASSQFEKGLVVYRDTENLKPGDQQPPSASGQYFVSLERSNRGDANCTVAFQMPDRALKVCCLLTSLSKSNQGVKDFLGSEAFYDWLLNECQKRWGLSPKTITRSSAVATIGSFGNRSLVGSGNFVFPDPNDPNSRNVWGHQDGLQVGLAIPPGPNGVIRIYTPYLGLEYPQVVNFITVEPTAVGQQGRDFSELNKSNIQPDQRGLEFWSSNSVSSSTRPAEAATGIVDERLGTLRVFIHMEPFPNGQKPIIECVFDRQYPHEVKFITHAAESSKPIAYCTLSATMGHYGLLNKVHLAGGRTVLARSHWARKQPNELGYLERQEWNQISSSDDGRYLVEFSSDAKPGNLNYRRDTPEEWKYKGEKAIQYWRAESGSRPRVAVSGRNTYWGSDAPMPVGTCFANTELMIPFKSGQAVWFGVRPDN